MDVELTRRQIMVLLGGGAAGGAAVIYTGTDAAMAVDANFASDVSITTDDGTITDVSLGSNLSVTLSWDGLDQAPANADVTISVKSDDAGAASNATLVRVQSHSLSDTSLSGSKTITASDFGTAPFSIINAHGNITASDFESTTDGATKDTTLTLQVEAIINNSSNNAIISNSSTDSYVVSVTNQSPSSSTSGTADTQVSG